MINGKLFHSSTRSNEPNYCKSYGSLIYSPFTVRLGMPRLEEHASRHSAFSSSAKPTTAATTTVGDKANEVPFRWQRKIFRIFLLTLSGRLFYCAGKSISSKVLKRNWKKLIRSSSGMQFTIGVVRVYLRISIKLYVTNDGVLPLRFFCQ